MVGWRDNTGLLSTHKSWEVIIGGEQNVTKTNLTTCYKQLFEWLRDYMAVDTVNLLLPVTDGQHLTVQATVGLEAEIDQKIHIPIGQGIAGRIAVSMQPMIVDRLASVKVFSPVLQQNGLQSLVGVPLHLKEGVVGVLHVGTFHFRQFSEIDQQQLQLVAQRLRLTLAPILLG